MPSCTRSSPKNRSSASTTSWARNQRRTSSLPLRQRVVRADLEPQLHRPCADRRSGDARTRQTCRFYEATGAYRDMVVTHLFQILAFMAMEPPTALEPAPISEEKNKVFRSMLPIDPVPPRGSTAELPGGHQGRRYRRGRRQRREPDDRRRAQGRRVHRDQHRRPGAADERRRRQARRRPGTDQGPGRGRQSRHRLEGRRRITARRSRKYSRAPTWCSSPPARAAAPGTGGAPVVASRSPVRSAR